MRHWIIAILLAGLVWVQAFEEEACAQALALTIFYGSPTNLIPAGIGPEYSFSQRSEALLIAWPVQIPYKNKNSPMGHKIVLSPEVATSGPAHGFRFRAGYRYQFPPSFRFQVGMGTTLSRVGASLSPEIGIRLGEPLAIALSLIARADVSLFDAKAHQASVLLGWLFW